MRWCLSEFKVGWLVGCLVGWLSINPFFPSLPFPFLPFPSLLFPSLPFSSLPFPSTLNLLLPNCCAFQQQNQFFGMRSSSSKRKQARQGNTCVLSEKLDDLFPGLRGRRGEFFIDCLLLHQPTPSVVCKTARYACFFRGLQIGSDRKGLSYLLARSSSIKFSLSQRAP